MSDHSKKHYCEAIRGFITGQWKFKVYRYDVDGNKEIVLHVSGWLFDTKERAEDMACEWCEDNGIDAEMA